MLLRPGLLTRPLRSPVLYRTLRRVSSAPPLIRIQDGTFYEKYPSPDPKAEKENPPLYPNLNFILPSGSSAAKGAQDAEPLQHWAIIGSTERTKLLEILRGQLICLPPAARTYPYLLTDEVAAKDHRLRYPGRAIQYVGFSGEGSQATGGVRGAYLSARYESLREDTDWTLLQYLKGQTSLNPLEGEENGTVHDQAFLEQVIANLRLEALLDMPVANLSNGQTRRARIAKALLSKPELLLLDDPFMGLDPATVRSISILLHGLAEKRSPRLILSLRPQDHLPDWITHMMVLGNAHRVLLQGDRSQIQEAFQVWKALTSEPASDKELKDLQKNPIYIEAKRAMDQGVLDRQLLRDLKLVDTKQRLLEITAPRGGEPVIEMDGVRVQYGDKVVLGNWKQKVNGKFQDGLHWKVRRGQRWAIIGANGSGKTTLLSLITSDHPQAYALPVRLFGRSRLPEPGKPGISIFELQSRIGHSSPEIHAFFPRNLTVRQALESAFADTFLSKPRLDHEKDLDVSAALRFFKADLDPDATTGDESSISKVKGAQMEMFPKLPNYKHQKHDYKPPDYDVDYADSLRFSSLNIAQQRLVLFIRAIVHKPDLVILDEAFSGMPASLRDKCLHFLEAGELKRNHVSTATRRTTAADTWLNEATVEASKARHKGLSDQQALLVISHLREEIPDSVRHWMRLPSDLGVGEPLDFKMGVLGYDSTLGGEAWDSVWSPRGTEKSRRTWRRRENDVGPQERDEDVYEYFTL
ncbi:conserved hypothetical protein [Paecilomyces variotii No. 5]|uniref:ABC transporter domain-containing protein n=1 Tax=Byssochlamys spectabilis (strain No. 5 / NBRC 109023) TaxID=1356009 RepID=V5FIW1_BYSSN|nr:conserved hypothetical protein [Paecilomyces variotii No. 5]